MLKKTLIAVAALLLVLVGVVVSRPDSYHVERSLAVQAPPDVVHAIVGDMNRFASYSPWQKLDPQMKTTVSSPSTGVGASYAWDSAKDDAGAGSMTIIAVEPNAKVVQDLMFLRPFESRAKVTFTTVAEGTGTKVTWAMDGDNGFMGKLMGLFMDMDAMIGKDFEEGLQNLSRVSLAEAIAAAELKAAATAATPPAALDTIAPPAPAGGKG
jgi:hypothetical protein